jgi:thioredoxin 1
MRPELPVLDDFWVDWCGPCRMVAPIIENISSQLDGLETYKKIHRAFSGNMISGIA